MTKQVLYCDICGKEVNSAMKYILPVKLHSHKKIIIIK